MRTLRGWLANKNKLREKKVGILGYIIGKTVAMVIIVVMVGERVYNIKKGEAADKMRRKRAGIRVHECVRSQCV